MYSEIPDNASNYKKMKKEVRVEQQSETGWP